MRVDRNYCSKNIGRLVYYEALFSFLQCNLFFPLSLLLLCFSPRKLQSLKQRKLLHNFGVQNNLRLRFRDRCRLETIAIEGAKDVSSVLFFFGL